MLLSDCSVCEAHVDRSVSHVAITRSIERHDETSPGHIIIPDDVIELAIFHDRCFTRVGGDTVLKRVAQNPRR